MRVLVRPAHLCPLLCPPPACELAHEISSPLRALTSAPIAEQHYGATSWALACSASACVEIKELSLACRVDTADDSGSEGHHTGCASGEALEDERLRCSLPTSREGNHPQYIVVSQPAEGCFQNECHTCGVFLEGPHRVSASAAISPDLGEMQVAC